MSVSLWSRPWAYYWGWPERQVVLRAFFLVGEDVPRETVWSFRYGWKKWILWDIRDALQSITCFRRITRKVPVMGYITPGVTVVHYRNILRYKKGRFMIELRSMTTWHAFWRRAPNYSTQRMGSQICCSNAVPTVRQVGKHRRVLHGWIPLSRSG